MKLQANGKLQGLATFPDFVEARKQRRATKDELCGDGGEVGEKSRARLRLNTTMTEQAHRLICPKIGGVYTARAHSIGNAADEEVSSVAVGVDTIRTQTDSQMPARRIGI